MRPFGFAIVRIYSVRSHSMAQNFNLSPFLGKGIAQHFVDSISLGEQRGRTPFVNALGAPKCVHTRIALVSTSLLSTRIACVGIPALSLNQHRGSQTRKTRKTRRTRRTRKTQKQANKHRSKAFCTTAAKRSLAAATAEPDRVLATAIPPTIGHRMH